MASRRIGGILELKVDGNQYLVKGSFTYNLGIPKKEMIVGMDGVHGYKETPQVPFIEGSITDTADISVSDLRKLINVTAVLRLANGKTISIEEAVEASDGDVTTEEGEIQVRFEGTKGTEIAA